MARSRLGALWLTASLGIACGTPDSARTTRSATTAPPATSRDSAGIRIVENSARFSSPVVYRRGDTPLLDVGGLHDDAQDEITAGPGYLQSALLLDGGLAVADRYRIVLYDRTGQRRHIVGRLGSGPEEFRGIQMLCRTRGDTLVVGDGELARFTIITGAGAVLRSFQRDEARAAQATACMDDGTFIAKRVERTGGAHIRFNISLLDTKGDTTAQLPGVEAAAQDLTTQSQTTLMASGELIHVADGVTSEVRSYDRTGRLVRLTRSADSIRAISDAEWEESAARRFPRGQAASLTERALGRMRVSPSRRKTWPAFRAVLADPKGGLWVQSYSAEPNSPFTTDSWAYFDPDGQLIGRLVMPPAVLLDVRAPMVLAFGDDTVLVARYDGDGALHLTLYPIIWTSVGK